MEDKKVKYGFGLSETECFSDMFDSIDELIAFAQDAYEHPDGNWCIRETKQLDAIKARPEN